MTPALPTEAALWLMPVAVPVGLWVIWSDMARMRIPNAAVLVLLAGYAVLGLLALEPAAWGWGWVRAAAVLVLGFGLNLAGLLGAGDAKFAAAMAAVVAPADAGMFALLLAGVMLAALATHRAVRRVRGLRALAPHWRSWRRQDFPLGLALGWALILYLGLAAAA